MNSQHTPGPWIIEQRYDERDFRITDGEDAWLFTMPMSRYVDESVPDSEAEANVLLAAAAPDLLAECRNVEILLADLRRGESLCMLPPLTEQIERLRAAIAKATGE